MAFQADFKVLYPKEYFQFDTVIVAQDSTHESSTQSNPDSLLKLTSESIFDNHELQVDNQGYITRPNTFDNNPFWFLIGGLIVLAIINIFYPRFTMNIIASGVIKGADKKQVNKEKENTGFLLTQAVNLIYIVNLSILIFWTLKYFGILQTQFSNIATQLVIVASVFVFSRLKTVAMYLYFVLYKYFASAEQIINLKRASENAIGVFLLALLWFIIYLDNIYFALAAFVITLIISSVRMFFSYRQIMSSTGFNHIQIIMYLCTLEILPLVVLLKVMYDLAF